MSQEIKICSSDSGCFLGGLSATDTICSGNQVVSNCFVKVGGTSSQFLKADGSVDSTGYTTCTGDVTGIDAGTAITVSDGATATPTVGVTTACNSAWNAKTTCTGTTTPSNTQTFTNKSGNISQWTNDSGYTTCAGDVTGIDAGTAITVSDGTTSTPSVAVTSTCNTAWNSAKSLADGLTTCAGLACVGDITGVTAGNGLSGGGTSSTVTLALDGAALTALNQSACAGINCTGTTTASNTQTFTNKSGSNSQWTNDAGYTTCAGTVTSIATGTGLDGTFTTSGTITLDLSELTDMTSAIDPGVDELILLDNGAERRKIFSEIFGSNAYNSTTIATNNNQLTNGCGYTTCTGTTTPSNTQTFTNKSGNISQWTNDSGYTTCAGDVTGITAGSLIDIDGGTTATPTVNVDLGELVDMTAAFTGTDELVVLDSGAQRRKAANEIGLSVFNNDSSFTTCTGTTTPSNTQTFTNKSGNISQWTNDSGYTTCTGDVTGIDAGTAITISDGTTSTPSVAVTSTCNTAWNSAKSLADGLTTCAGLACVGDITAVTTGPYLTGGATSGSAEVGIDSACAAKWDTAAAGDISEVIAGTNLTGGGSSGSVTLNMATGGAGAATYGNTSNSCKIDTITLDAYGRVTAVACGPTGDITGVTAGNGLSGGGTSGTPTLALDGDALTGLNQSACAGLNCVGDITNVSVGTGLAGGGGSGSVTLCVDATCNSTWNAKTTCTGTTTPSNTQTFTNKSGNISQWTNDSGYTTCTGTTTPSNTQTFTNKSGNISQWTNNSGYTTCTGDITGVTAGNGLSGGATSGTATLALDGDALTALNQSGCAGLNCVGTITAVNVSTGISSTGGTSPTICINATCNSTWNAKTTCTGTTTPSNTQTFTNKSGNISQWTNDSGYTTCNGDITGVTAGTLLDGGGTSGSVTLNVDLSELTDGTAAIVPSTDEVVYLDAGVQKRKLFSEIFGSNAYNSTTIPTNNTQLTNGCGFTTCTGTVVAGDISSFTSCTGTTTPSNTQTFTNKSGSNSQWTNDAGYTTCTGDITNVTAGTLLDGGGASGSVTLNVDLSELTDGTAAIVPTSDEIVYLDAGSQKRKLFSEIFGSNAYNSTTIPTNNTQLTNGCGFTTCTGTTTPSNSQTFTNKGGNISQWTNDSGYTTCTGTTTPSNTQTFTNKSGNISQWTNNSGYTTCTGDITGVTAGAGLSGGATSGTATVALDGVMVATLNQSGCAGLNCTGTTTPSNTQTFTNKSGSNSQWTNDAGYTGCTGTTTPSNTQTFTNKSGNISQWTNDSGYTTCTGTVVAGDISSFTTCTGTLRPAGTIATNDFAKYDASGCLVGRSCTETRSDLGINTAANCTAASLDQSGCAGLLCTGTTTASNTQTFTNKSGSNSQWTNDAGYTTCTGTTTPSNTQTFTNKAGNISQWTNDSGYTTCTGDITGVTAGAGLSGGGTSGTATVALDGAMVATLNQSGCAGIDCVGTITAVNVSTGIASTGGTAPTICINSTCNTAWNAKTTCTGTVTSVTGGNGITSSGGTAPAISTCFYGDFSQKILTTCGSVCLGTCAGKSISEGSGTGNVAIGKCALCTTTTGDNNLAIGAQALQSNITGSRNVGIGDVAGFRITGSDNLVFGRSAGCGITSAGCNVIIGNYAHRTSTNNGTGASNVAIGTQAMRDNVSGACNVAIGFCAGQEISTGCKNIAMGPCALGATTGIVTGHCNIAIGEATAWKNTSGSNNIAMGFVALGCNCTGSCNVAIGYTAGRFTGTGTTQMQAPTRSIFIGCDSTGGGGSSTNNETVIGSGAVGCGSNTVMLGNSSVTVVCSNGTFSTVSDLRDKTCICDLELGLDFIGDLKPKTFNMITDRDDPEGSISCKRHGFIAQDVLALEGDDNVIISKTNPERLGYTGEHIIPILVKGMQEQQAIIDDLKTRLEVLEG